MTAPLVQIRRRACVLCGRPIAAPKSARPVCGPCFVHSRPECTCVLGGRCLVPLYNHGVSHGAQGYHQAPEMLCWRCLCPVPHSGYYVVLTK